MSVHTSTGTHESMDSWNNGYGPTRPIINGPCHGGSCSGDVLVGPPDPTQSNDTTTQPVAQKNPASGGTGSSSSTANNTNSTSPEFNALMNTLNGLAGAGATIQPPLQDNNSPVAVPTQTTSKNTSLAIILFLIAGAAGYYYYRKHGGPSVHEAL